MTERVNTTKEKIESEEIKKIILEILLEFQKCCERQGLRFFLSGGTLLGAIRHQGFIPWDDDIDLCMPRPDYEKLIRLNKEQTLFPEYLELVCFEEGTLSYPFMKLLDRRTLMARDYIAGEDTDRLWIDIFPVDGLPDGIQETEEIYRKAASIRKKFMLAKARYATGTTLVKKIAKLFITPVMKLIGAKHYATQLVKLAEGYSFETSAYVGAITWGLYGVGERMEKEAFLKEAQVSFEGHTFPTMSCWESYLCSTFGDYMTLPPEEKRVTHEMTVWRLS